MNKILLTILACALLASPAFLFAELESEPLPLRRGDTADFSLTDGREFPGARIIDVGLKDIVIMHEGAIVSIHMDRLPDEMQKQFSFDPAKAQAKEARREEARQELARKQREQQALQQMEARLRKSVISAQVKVLQVLPGGILAEPITAAQGLPYKETVPVTTRSRRGHGLYPDEMVPKTTMVSRTRHDRIDIGDRIYIRCETAGLVDDQRMDVVIWPIGTHTYTSVLGAAITVRSFATDPVEYMRGRNK